jgi:hypothetical protein
MVKRPTPKRNARTKARWVTVNDRMQKLLALEPALTMALSSLRSYPQA